MAAEPEDEFADVQIPLADLKQTFQTLTLLAKNYETAAEGWYVINEARELVAREVCEQHGYEEMKKLVG